METRGQDGDMPLMKGLVACENKLKEEGYSENFQVTKYGLSTYNDTDKHYSPEQVKIENFYRFEGTSDPGDNTILYAIITDDGTKGTLVDGYGAYSDSEVSKFITEVNDIQKKIFS